MPSDSERSELELEEDVRAEQAAADLKTQMGELKARYRVERRRLESRSFETDGK